MTKREREAFARFTRNVCDHGKTDSSLFLFAQAAPSYAKRLHRAYERECNGYQDWQGNWDQKAADRAEKRTAKIENEFKALAEECGFLTYIQSDPRGCPLYLYTQAQVDAYNQRCGTDYKIDSIYSSVAIPVPF